MFATKKLKISGGNNVTYDFSDFKAFNELFRDLYHKKMTIIDAKMKQNESNLILDALNNYFPITKKYIEAKNSLQKYKKLLQRERRNYRRLYRRNISVKL